MIVALLVGLTAAVAADPRLPPTVEIDYVSMPGCTPQRPRRGATQCGAEAATRLTIRGRRFGVFGATVFLSNAAAPRAPPVECTNVVHSPLLDSLMLFCDAPPLPPAATFHVTVATHDGLSAILRDAVTTVRPGATGGRQGAWQQLEADQWRSLGVGGLGRQIRGLFRRAFASRLHTVAALASKTGVRHVRGVILHGLPGTGKTLLARKIAGLLDAGKVQVVNGPEIMSKWVGESEKNLRHLFEAAEADYARDGDRAPLHVIIFDEIDAIMRARGSGDDSAARAVYDGVTTQMLAYMDGVKSVNNLLIIGLTNRLDSLDKALLRPGRFEVQIRFPLPDADGRREIFAIHTQQLADHGYIAPGVDLRAIAHETTSLSGADIAGSVRSAVSYALARVHELVEAEPDTAAEDAFRVTQDDLRRGVREVLAGKSAAAALQPHMPHGFRAVNGHTHALVARLLSLAEQQRSNAGALPVVRVLLQGPPQAGLTATAAFIAHKAQFPAVHVVTPTMLTGLSTNEKVERLRQAFDAAYQSPRACVVLDGLESIVEYRGGTVNAALQTELALLMRPRPRPPREAGGEGSATEDGKVFVITTSTNADCARLFNTDATAFDVTEELHALRRHEVAEVLQAYRVAGSAEEAQGLARRLPASLPLKRLLFWIEVARGGSPSAALRPSGDELTAIDGTAPEAFTDTVSAAAFERVMGQFSDGLLDEAPDYYSALVM